MSYSSAAVEFRAEPPAPQRRLTVFFRLILVIPHFIVLYFLSIVLIVCVFLAWFVAIFTGRNPFFKMEFGIVGYVNRVIAYLLFLTDRYPNFSLDPEESYPVVIALERAPLGRASVFFRAILVIPVYFVATAVMTGSFIIGIGAWFIVLIRGQLPEPLHEAYAAAIRFLTRMNAYLYLLQDPYPRGLFGDHVPSATAVAPSVVAPTSVVTSYGGLLPVAPPLTDLAPTSKWPLRVGASARRLLIVILVVGILTNVGSWINDRSRFHNAFQSVEVTAWSNSHYFEVEYLYTATQNVETTLNAKTIVWGKVSNGCVAVQKALTNLAHVPQYPESGPNQLLVSGYAAVSVATNECITNIVPSRSSSQVAALSARFDSGSGKLGRFLNGLTIPS